MNPDNIQSLLDVNSAYERIKPYLYLTPVIQSESLNEMLGHKIYFKIDALQKTGSFKVRGVLNHLLSLKEQNILPTKVVAYSTGNHGIGLAWVAKLLKIQARIYLPKNTSQVKQQSARYYGAEVICTATRQEAEDMADKDAKEGYYYLHPSDSDATIKGAATLCFEALNQLNFKPDAIFASCGGGGLLTGSFLSKELISPNSLLIGSEPLNANDAYLSLKQNKIFKFSNSPETVADGLRTLAISERTFKYIKKLDELLLIDEYSINYWTAWLIHLLKIVCEPSCALNMEAVKIWLKTQSSQKKVLVLITGGNIDPLYYSEIVKEDYLQALPNY